MGGNSESAGCKRVNLFVYPLSDIPKPVNKSEVIFIASAAIYYSYSKYRKSMDCLVGC